MGLGQPRRGACLGYSSNPLDLPGGFVQGLQYFLTGDGGSRGNGLLGYLNPETYLQALNTDIGILTNPDNLLASLPLVGYLGLGNDVAGAIAPGSFLGTFAPGFFTGPFDASSLLGPLDASSLLNSFDPARCSTRSTQAHCSTRSTLLRCSTRSTQAHCSTRSTLLRCSEGRWTQAHWQPTSRRCWAASWDRTWPRRLALSWERTSPRHSFRT